MTKQERMEQAVNEARADYRRALKGDDEAAKKSSGQRFFMALELLNQLDLGLPTGPVLKCGHVTSRNQGLQPGNECYCFFCFGWREKVNP